MRTVSFDFELPEERIALRPAVPRNSARMLVVLGDGTVKHARIQDLPKYLTAGDCVVVNDSKVIFARLRGTRLPREPLAGFAPKIEVMLHKRLSADRFLALGRPGRRLKVGDRLMLGRSLRAEIVARGGRGEIELRFAQAGAELERLVAAEGELPLPPYIASRRQTDTRDAQDYQTVYAREAGSVAAPTAGLHFTPGLLEALAAHGVSRQSVTLHIGAGTFLPVGADDTDAHKMHGEYAVLKPDAARRLNEVRASGGRIVAVGTTSLRTLESAADAGSVLRPHAAETDIFITPGYRFLAVDVLLTNFHLPRSTLFMLVCALCGLDKMKAVYAEAIREGYRFYSYGDACLLFRPVR